MNSRIKFIQDWLEERKNEAGVAQIRNARDIALTDFGRFTKYCYELVESSFPPPIVKGQASDTGGGIPPQDAGPSAPPNPDSKAVSDCLHRLVSRLFRFVLTNDVELGNSLMKDESINLNKVDVDFGGYSKSDKFIILLNSGNSLFIWMTKQIYKFLRFIFPVRFDSYRNQEPSLFLNFLGNVPIGVNRAFKFSDGLQVGWIHNGFLLANVQGQARR
jgi:hypothetical protein